MTAGLRGGAPADRGGLCPTGTINTHHSLSQSYTCPIKPRLSLHVLRSFCVVLRQHMQHHFVLPGDPAAITHHTR